MREIKFRLWNDYDKKMMNWNELLQRNLPNIFTIPSYQKWLMQYTGLKDKNGKEIYEGDIVKKLIWNELKFEAEGDGQDYSYAKVQYIEELASFHLVNKNNKILWEVGEDKYNIEVAGNIYDNPELLKGEQS